MPGRIKHGGGPDSARGPCVCLLWSRECRQLSPVHDDGTPHLQDREEVPLFEGHLVNNQPIKSLSITKIRSQDWVSVPPTPCCPLQFAHRVRSNLIFREKTERHDLPQAYPLPKGLSDQLQK